MKSPSLSDDDKSAEKEMRGPVEDGCVSVMKTILASAIVAVSADTMIVLCNNGASYEVTDKTTCKLEQVDFERARKRNEDSESEVEDNIYIKRKIKDRERDKL